jgi:hypothetical protein
LGYSQTLAVSWAWLPCCHFLPCPALQCTFGNHQAKSYRFTVPVKQWKQPQAELHIYNHVTFAPPNTIFGQQQKPTVNYSLTFSAKHFYFKHIITLWNSLPPIDLDQPLTHLLTDSDSTLACTHHHICPCSQCALQHTCGPTSSLTLTQPLHAPITTSVPAHNVPYNTYFTGSSTQSTLTIMSTHK